MQNISKIIVLSTISAFLFLGFVTKASTGDLVNTNTTLPYTGSLLTYIYAQESGINAAMTTTYNKLYTTFSKTGFNILRSIDYQSLVCFGAIPSESVVSQMMKDKAALMMAFKKDFIGLENQIADSEEKQNFQKENQINMFDSGTTYESEKAKIKNEIDAKVTLYTGFINNFDTTYTQKTTEFFSTFLQFSAVNKNLIKNIQDNMAKVQGVIDEFSGVESVVNKINAKVTGLDNLLQKIDDLTTKGFDGLDKSLQPLIDTTIKKYTKLQNITGDLSKQKEYVINQYGMDLDQYLTNALQNRYNRSQYLALKEQVNNFVSRFYIAPNQLNCTNIVTIPDAEEINSLGAKITAMNAVVNSGWAKLESEGISTTVKDQIYSGFQSVYIQKFKQRYAEFVDYIKGYITTALKNLVSSIISIPVDTGNATGAIILSPAVKITTIFTRSFTSNEYNQDIKALQNLLTTLNLYSGAINGIYDKATKNAVYQFQLSKGLLKGYEKKSSVRGWMGPATRNALNKIVKTQ